MRLAILLLTCALAVMAQTETFRLMPPDAKAVIGVKLQGLLQSAAGRQMKEQVQKQMSQASPAAAGMAGILLGLLDSVDSVLITSSSSEFFKSARGPSTARAAQPPVLIVVSGRFDSSGLAGLLQSASKSQPELYRGVSIFRGDAKEVDKNRMALLDPNTLLLGDRKELTGAIDRARGVQPPGEASARLTSLAENDFFFSMDVPAGAVPPPSSRPGSQDPMSQMMRDVTGVDMGVRLGQGMSTAVDLRTASSAAAERIAPQVQALITLGAMYMTEQPEMVKLLQRITVKPGASGVRLALAISEAEVLQITQAAQRRAAAPAGQSAPVRQGPAVIDGLGGSTVVQTEKPQAAPSGGIKISGLDPEPKPTEAKKP